MSAAFFGAEDTNEIVKFIEAGRDTMVDNNVRNCDGGDCRSTESIDSKQDEHLHEMGEAIEIAETRCNTLKQQLDFMKKLYNPKNEAEAAKKDSYRSRSSVTKERAVNNFTPALQKHSLVRQNSEAITTDNSGAAVVTINNILNGITTSINRLSQLHNYIEVDKSSSSSIRKKRFGQRQNMNYGDSNIDTKDYKKSSKRRSSGSLDGSSFINTTKKSSKRGTTGKDDSMTKDSSSTLLKKRKFVKRFKVASKPSMARKTPKGPPSRASTKNLVEIYLNSAAKESDSDDSNGPGRNHHGHMHTKISHIEVNSRKLNKDPVIVPPIQIQEANDVNAFDNRARVIREVRETCLSPINEQSDLDALDNIEVDYNNFGHNYELPTLASKMKRVAKGYFRQFDFKTIPFCAAKSTSPSHNIGINIQQVMSIIKARQPLQGISPTLAHNIGIAADKLQNRPLSDLVSTIGSRMGCNYGQMQCPLTRMNTVNYHQMQEMAKDIPEETYEEIEQLENENFMEEQSNKIEDTAVWSIDPNNDLINCTCIPRQGVGFQQVINRYQPQTQPQQPSMANSQVYDHNNTNYADIISRKSAQKYRNIKSVYAQNNKKYAAVRTSLNKANNNLPLNGKEKVLKGVLCNLHDEFAKLTSKYDELSACLDNENQSNENTMRELEDLEKKLNDKEEEIMMVMSLYKEVVALKEQVKTLKEKASLASIVVQQHRQEYTQPPANQQQYQHTIQYQGDLQNGEQYQQPAYHQPKFKENDPSPAFQLQKLLKQIQSFQELK